MLWKPHAALDKTGESPLLFLLAREGPGHPSWSAGSRVCGVRLLPHLLMGQHRHVSSPWTNGLPTAYLRRLLGGVGEEVVPPASHSAWDMLSAHQAASLIGTGEARPFHHGSRASGETCKPRAKQRLQVTASGKLPIYPSQIPRYH